LSLSEIQSLGPGGYLQFAIFANQGLVQSVSAVYEVQPELAFETGLSVIGGGVPVRDCTDEFVPFVDFQSHLAANWAVGAGAGDRRYGLVPFVVSLDQRAGGAYVDAGSAEFAA
jgi:hypothetical protein